MALLLTGCPPVTPEPAQGLSITAANNTSDAVLIEFSIDGVAESLEVPANGRVSQPLVACPQTVTLTRLRLQSSSGRVILTEFGDLSGVSLARDANFACGDALSLVVGVDATVLQTIPGG